ncbi:hypothetical protein Nepgr_020948 [Nepenthes gracilis]|uniref:Uncharacterized protein n=1 Tax=Nepenthes gracilis TaxID=150966 RepID=A0AAD3XVI2_NEPGR|nr:hypothetical protein Nepgr_020948 [Nepenthes gracilis]
MASHPKFLSGALPKDLQLSISPKAGHNKRLRKTFYLDVRLHTSPESLPDFPLTIARSQFHTRIFSCVKSSPILVPTQLVFAQTGNSSHNCSQKHFVHKSLRIFLPRRSPAFSLAGLRIFPGSSPKFSSKSSLETSIFSGDLISLETFILSGDLITPETSIPSGDLITPETSLFLADHQSLRRSHHPRPPFSPEISSLRRPPCSPEISFPQISMFSGDHYSLREISSLRDLHLLRISHLSRDHHSL